MRPTSPASTDDITITMSTLPLATIRNDLHTSGGRLQTIPMASSQEPEKLYYQTIPAIFNSKGPCHPPGICDLQARPPVDIPLAHIMTIQPFGHFLALP